MIVETVPLRELCDVRIGRTPSRSDARYWGGPGIWISISELHGRELRDSREHISELAMREVMPPPVPAGTLLFSFKLSIGKMAVSAVPLYTNEAIAALPIRNPERLDREYLRYALMATSGAAQTNHAVLGAVLNKAKVEALPIPLVPMFEQRRIVDLLSRAENIVRMRREAEQRAKEIIPALFLDMFGDPATNPKGWRTTTLGEVVADGPQNGLYKHADTYGSGTPILRIDGFYDGRVRPLAEWKRLRLDETEARRFRLTEGDIVINRVNSPEYLGKSAIIPVLEEPAVYESNMMRVSMRREHANPEFAIAYLQTAFARSALIKNAKHAINQSSINQGDVKSVLMYLPPISEQNVFRARAADGRSLEYQQGRATEQAKQTFQALLAGVFSVGRAT